jgi:hypothetical protein
VRAAVTVRFCQRWRGRVRSLSCPLEVLRTFSRSPAANITRRRTRPVVQLHEEKPSLRDGLGRIAGAGDRNRTYDPIITNDVLYQLSYSGAGRNSRQTAPQEPAFQAEKRAVRDRYVGCREPLGEPVLVHAHIPSAFPSPPAAHPGIQPGGTARHARDPGDPARLGRAGLPPPAGRVSGRFSGRTDARGPCTGAANGAVHGPLVDLLSQPRRFDLHAQGLRLDAVHESAAGRGFAPRAP